MVNDIGLFDIYLCVCMWHTRAIEVRGQLLRTGSLLPSCEFQRLEPGTLNQLTDLSGWPTFSLSFKTLAHIHVSALTESCSSVFYFLSLVLGVCGGLPVKGISSLQVKTMIYSSPYAPRC